MSGGAGKRLEAAAWWAGMAGVLYVASTLVKRRRRKKEVPPLDVRLGLTEPLSTTTTTTTTKIRWAFLGAGRVAHDFANALKTVPGAVLHCVATRSASPRCEAFRKLHGFSKAYESYSEALADPEVDVVYLSAMHSERLEHASAILRAGKHAVVEKPIACSRADAARLFEIAAEKKLFLMEGMWTRFFPAVERARHVIDSGEIGLVTAVLSDFGFDAADSGKYPKDFGDASDGDPIYHAAIGGGALLWTGPYPIAAGIMPFGAVEPAALAAAGVADAGRTGVELSLSIALSYASPGGGEGPAGVAESSGCPARGATVSLFTGIDSETVETTTYVGQRGRVTVLSPGHCPTKLLVQVKKPGRGTTEDTHFDFGLPPLPRSAAKTANGGYFNYPNSLGFAYEAAAVMRCLHAGLTECPQYTTAECLRTLDIIDKARAQVREVRA
ncbi:hypothetical protein CTAYLR_002842 [Chrysophaeum taylorii]|uniref:D-xylose 1-dehydrogenase (NADP(+), D-xylono-1,5-lactone-forming) n=1 Tax=Chrysophaeum taylorii TaxID=2483200 RepID=A0AAD7XIU6_9STRA|nr:hypothetical protein CTAYLR_002842 [Chrysophaeum taylorii]